MENFIDINNLNWLSKIRDNLIEEVSKDLEYFLLNMPVEQKIKYQKIQDTEFIKMYALPIYYDKEKFCPCSGETKELFNFTIDGPEQNYDGGNGPKAREMEQLIGQNYSYDGNYLFSNILKLIPHEIRTGWVFFYKEGAVVNEPNGHGHTTIMIHFLLHDIEEGYLEVNVNGEIKKFNKKGDYFIFNGILPHSANFNGKKAKFLTLAMNEEDLRI